MTTIFGANFDHKTETPNPGAEIKESFFTDKFKSKNWMSKAQPCSAS